jgi:hypothetical protein
MNEADGGFKRANDEGGSAPRRNDDGGGRKRTFAPRERKNFG